MATLRPFRAVRPESGVAQRVAAVPYDVVDGEEARALAAGNPLSFLHVSRAEIDLPRGTDPHADAVYGRAAEQYRRLRRDAPLREDEQPSIYIYRLHSDGHTQTGLAACFSVDEYERGLIKKHERTRREKEDDRTRHIVELRAQTGPVFLTYRPMSGVEEAVAEVTEGEPLADFEAVDGVRHSIWRAAEPPSRALIDIFAGVEALYIADGHHRAASAARARTAIEDSPEADWFLGVAFPADQVRILAYNRVADLNGLSPEAFLGELARRGLMLHQGPAVPEEKGDASVYVAGRWHTIDLESAGMPGAAPVDQLDCNLLQERVLAPVLGIADVRSDRRVDFVGGVRGTRTLEQLVDSGRWGAAFSLYPVSVQELMAVSDAGAIMPPKSTWFEPKLRDGLLIHEL